MHKVDEDLQLERWLDNNAARVRTTRGLALKEPIPLRLVIGLILVAIVLAIAFTR